MQNVRIWEFMLFAFYVIVSQGHLIKKQQVSNATGGTCLRPEGCEGFWITTACGTNYVCYCLPGYVLKVNPGKQKECVRQTTDVQNECPDPRRYVSNLLRERECAQNSCQCQLNAVSTKCRPIINRVGEHCDISQQCTLGTLGPRSECVGLKNGGTVAVTTATKICNCTSAAVHGTDPNTGVSSCHQKKDNLGETCLFDAQCSANMGVISRCVDGKCGCQENGILNVRNTTCLEKATMVGDPCEESTQCQWGAPGPHSVCRNYTCHCTSCAMKDPDDKKCLLKASFLGDSCERDVQCQVTLGEDSRCKNNTCHCTNEAVSAPGENACLKKAVFVEDPCQIDGQCTAKLGRRSECSLASRKCVCKSGYVSNTTFCSPPHKNINEACSNDADCVGEPGTSSICSTGICTCKPCYVASASLDNCLQIHHTIGAPCKEGPQCQQGQPGPHSDCILNLTSGPNVKTCQCTGSSVREPGKHTCLLKAVQVGDPCQVIDQCVAGLDNSRCHEEKCVCDDNATASPDKTRCVRKSKTGITADASSNCEAGYESFIPQQCSRLAVVLGDSCSDDPQQCRNITDSRCNGTSKVCDCDLESHVVDDSMENCLAKRNLHASCEEDKQCPTEGKCLRGGTNTQKTCQCQPNEFVESANTAGTCVKILREEGSTCEDDAQCTTGIGAHSSCNQGQCRCFPQYIFWQGLCTPKLPIGSGCTSDEECEAGANSTLAHCRKPDSVCECAPPSFYSDSSCWNMKHVGDPCGRDKECAVSILGPALCRNLKCECKEGYKANSENMVCSSASTPQYVTAVVAILLITIL